MKKFPRVAVIERVVQQMIDASELEAVQGGEGTCEIEVTLYHCGEDGLCRVTRAVYEVEYEVEPGGATSTRLSGAR